MSVKMLGQPTSAKEKSLYILVLTVLKVLHKLSKSNIRCYSLHQYSPKLLK